MLNIRLFYPILTKCTFTDFQADGGMSDIAPGLILLSLQPSHPVPLPFTTRHRQPVAGYIGDNIPPSTPALNDPLAPAPGIHFHPIDTVDIRLFYRIRYVTQHITTVKQGFKTGGFNRAAGRFSIPSTVSYNQPEPRRSFPPRSYRPAPGQWPSIWLEPPLCRPCSGIQRFLYPSEPVVSGSDSYSQ